MPKVTIAELQKQLENYKRLFNTQVDENVRLNRELEETRKGLNVVSCSEFDGVLVELDRQKTQYKVLESLYEKEKSKKKGNPNLENDNWLLRCENESLRQKIAEIENVQSTVGKIEHNARGAGRKEYQDVETIRRIFSMYLERQSLQGIANTLNQEHIPTKAGGTWAKSSVRFVLLNRSYVDKGIVEESVYKLITEQMAKGRKKNS